jgi:ribosomal protein L11
MKLLEKLAFGKVGGKKEKDTDILRKIRLSIPAQAASIAPPLGPVLGQFGINIIEFCRQFNELTKFYEVEVMVNVMIIMYRNKTFNIYVNPPSVSFLVYELYNSKLLLSTKKAIEEEQDLKIWFTPNYTYPKKLDFFEFYKILKYKNNFSNFSLESDAKSMLGTLKSMNITIFKNLSSKI